MHLNVVLYCFAYVFLNLLSIARIQILVRHCHVFAVHNNVDLPVFYFMQQSMVLDLCWVVINLLSLKAHASWDCSIKSCHFSGPNFSSMSEKAVMVNLPSIMIAVVVFSSTWKYVCCTFYTFQGRKVVLDLHFQCCAGKYDKHAKLFN